MRKIILMLIVTLLGIVLSGCSEAKVFSETTIFNKSGAGTRTLFINIERDHKFSAEDRAKGNVNSVFFPNGFEPVREYIQSLVPEGCVVGFEEQRDHWVYTITYSFNDIDDYNKKTRELINDIIYEDEELEPAVLTVVERDGGWDVTFKEKTAVAKAIVMGYIAELHFNEEVFDRTGGGRGSKKPRENFSFDRVTVKIGKNAIQYFNKSSKYVETTKFISYEDNHKYEDENLNKGQSTPVAEAAPGHEIAESASYKDNTRDLHNDGNSESGRKSTQHQKILLIAFILPAVILSIVLITIKVRSKPHKQKV